MQLSKLPFNVKLFDDVPNSYLGMIPVLTAQIFEGGTGEFNPEGLYSTQIFGQTGTTTRDEKESYINLRVPIFNPLIFDYLIDLKALYRDIIYRQGYAVFDKDLKDFVRADVLTGQTGFAFFMEHFQEIEFKRNNSQRRDLWIDLIEKHRTRAFIKRFIVIPAGLRDIEITEEGQPKEEEINKLYRRILSVVNTINADFETRNSQLLDAAKASLQKAVQAVYDYIVNMLNGKRGLFQSKYAARSVIGATRNVLSSQEVGSNVLGDERQPGFNTITCGMFQFLKGNQIWVTEYGFRNGFLADFYQEDEQVTVINRKTLKAEKITLKADTRERWMTSDGLGKSIDKFEDAKLRHKPVVIDNHFLRLVYQDDNVFKVFNSIDELPSNLDKSKVHPITWGEMFYLVAYPLLKKVRGIATRYPITGLGSTFPGYVYLKSTVTGMRLHQLDDHWNPSDGEVYEFPTMGMAWYETMSVSPLRLGGLGADFDGDVLSLTFVIGDEAVKQIDENLVDIYKYLNPRGGLLDPIIGEETSLVLSFMTGHND